MGVKANQVVASGAYQNTLVLTTTPGYIAEPTITNVYNKDTTTNATGPTTGGTAIDIIGTNLDTAYQVFIDLNGNNQQDTGEQCTSPNIVSATKITCTTPAHSTVQARNVVVNTWGGNATKLNGFEYEAVEEIWGFTVDTSISTNVTFRAAADVPLQVDFGDGSWVNFATGATISGTAIPTTGVAPLSRIRVRPQDASSYNWFPIGTEGSPTNAVLNPINHLKTLDYPVTTRSISDGSGNIAKPLAYAFYDATSLTTPVSFANSNGVNISGSIGSSFLSYTHYGNTALTSPIDLAPLAGWSVTSVLNSFLSYTHYGNTALTSPIDLAPLAGWSATSVLNSFLVSTHRGNTSLASPIDLTPLAGWNVTSIGSGFLFGTHHGNTSLTSSIDLTPLTGWSVTSIGSNFLYNAHSGNTSLTSPIDLTPLAGWGVTSIGSYFLSQTHFNNTELLDISSFRLPNWAKDKIVGVSNALYRTFYLSSSTTTTGGEPRFMDGTVISSAGSPSSNRYTYTNRSSITPQLSRWK